ncbi:MAG: hypothetical protein ACE5E9_05060 [Nitrospinaceae bacterium]
MVLLVGIQYLLFDVSSGKEKYQDPNRRDPSNDGHGSHITAKIQPFQGKSSFFVQLIHGFNPPLLPV